MVYSLGYCVATVVVGAQRYQDVCDGIADVAVESIAAADGVAGRDLYD